MISGGKKGSSTKTGIEFEDKVSLLKHIQANGDFKTSEIDYMKNGFNIIRTTDNKTVTQNFSKYDFYRFLENKGINWKQKLSKRLRLMTFYLLSYEKLFLLLKLSIKSSQGLLTKNYKRVILKENNTQNWLKI